jgi:hypothetical protein
MRSIELMMMTDKQNIPVFFAFIPIFLIPHPSFLAAGAHVVTASSRNNTFVRSAAGNEWSEDIFPDNDSFNAF